MNERYYARYPEDRARVRDDPSAARRRAVPPASGDRLTARRFRQIGLWLGDSAGWELLHHVLELPMDSPGFRHDVGRRGPFRRGTRCTRPSTSRRYADGVATRWSADRLLPDEIRDGVAFTAEHVYPWMFDDYGALRAHKAAAEILAEHEWPRLFDAAQLAVNEVPVAATIYVDDLYVERAFAEETAAAIRGLRRGSPTSTSTTGARRRRARPRPADRPRARTRLTDVRSSAIAALRRGSDAPYDAVTPSQPTYGARPRPLRRQDAWARDGRPEREVCHGDRDVRRRQQDVRRFPRREGPQPGHR